LYGGSNVSAPSQRSTRSARYDGPASAGFENVASSPICIGVLRVAACSQLASLRLSGIRFMDQF